MAYQRKTHDEWDIEQNWEYIGWERVVSADSPDEACRLLREYRENQPGIPVRIKKRRVVNTV